MVYARLLQRPRLPEADTPRQRMLSLGEPCAYCAEPMADPTRDHVMPACRGYKFADFNGRNRAWVCRPCNTTKKHYDIFQFLDRMVAGADPRARVVAAFAAEFLAE